MKKRVVLFGAVGLILMLVSTHADTIVLDSGGSIRGVIIEEDLDKVVVRDPLRGITTTFDRDEIVEIKRAGALEKEYDKKLKQIMPGDTYGYTELAKWCRKRGLKEQQRDLLKRILEIYPDDTKARRELDILDGKLPASAREKDTDSDGLTFAPGESGAGKTKKKYKVRKIWGDKKSGSSKSGKPRPSKFKPKGSTKAGFKGLDWLLEHGPRIRYAPQGQVVSASFCGLACLASRDNKYTGLLDRCVNMVKGGLKRYHTGKREARGRFTQSNWALSIGGMFLAEALPYYKSKEIKEILQKTVDQLVIQMEESDGWGHDSSGPNPLNYVEIEIMSNFAVACMGMCKQLGISVPKEKLAKAIAYIEKCVTGRGVAYSHKNKWGHVSRTGGALFALAMAGARKSRKFPILCVQMNRMMSQVKFGHSTPSLSFWQCAVGSLQVGRTTWDKYVQTWFPVILEHQEDDGSFRSIVNPKEGLKFEKSMKALITGIYSFVLLVDRSKLRFCSGCSRGK